MNGNDELCCQVTDIGDAALPEIYRTLFPATHFYYQVDEPLNPVDGDVWVNPHAYVTSVHNGRYWKCQGALPSIIGCLLD